MTTRLAVLGAEVAGSLSPFLHESAARALGHDVSYVAESCPDEASFGATVLRLRAEGARGLNVTAPYKRAAFELSEVWGPEALEIGMVNTLSFDPPRPIRGDNTDGPGMVDLLGRLPPEVSSSITILGGGGVARAALWAARRHRADSVAVIVRDLARMSEVGDLDVPVRTFDEAMIGPGLVISALTSSEEATARALAVLPPPSPATFILDLAYGGLGFETELVAQARSRGHHAADGRGLLAGQAARAYRIWMGGELSAIESAMRDALKKRDPVSALL